jgi:ankyrin repeat protein
MYVCMWKWLTNSSFPPATTWCHHGYPLSGGYLLDLIVAEIRRWHSKGKDDAYLKLKLITRRSLGLHCKCIFRSANVNSRNKDGLTPLLKAARKGHMKTVKILLDKRADVRATDKNEKSAIFLAAAEDNLDTLQVRICFTSSHKILDRGKYLFIQRIISNILWNYFIASNTLNEVNGVRRGITR